jgi:uncharacterized membrane protein YdjX (TVP38/TMEM64 family)
MKAVNAIKPNARNVIILVVIILAVILIPFFLFGYRIEEWTNQFLKPSANNKIWAATVISFLLAADIFLPVPSSIVSTGSGYLLGFLNGSLASFAGMTIGCVIGYFFAINSRKALQWIGQDNFDRLEKFFQRSGAWAIVLARPIPVLAEASVLFAGISRMKFSRFMIASTFSNLGISIVYATVGAYSVSINSFLLAFSGAIIIPAIAKLIGYWYSRKSK